MRDTLNSAQCSKYLKAVADPERLKILQCLQEGPRPVSEVARQMNLPMGNVSHHLKQLRIAGLISSERKGRSIIYSLAARILRKDDRSALNVLEFGCCRIELGSKPVAAKKLRSGLLH